jgi:hypothetical protein
MCGVASRRHDSLCVVIHAGGLRLQRVHEIGCHDPTLRKGGCPLVEHPGATTRAVDEDNDLRWMLEKDSLRHG